MIITTETEQEAKMPKRILKTFAYLFLGMMVGGCASIKARSYIETKELVDQDIDGNAGYLNGTPPEAAKTAPAKKTRDIYVLEITKKAPDEEDTIKNDEEELMAESSPGSPTSHPQSWFVPPSSLPAQYTVGKDETLQTIAKKFYNSYSKWPKIYEANKDKISDPNHIRTGAVLTIPVL